MAKGLLAMGLMLIFMGLGFWFFAGRDNWFGKTPLDFVWRSGKTQVYFPLGSMLVLSIAATLIINLLLRCLRK